LFPLTVDRSIVNVPETDLLAEETYVGVKKKIPPPAEACEFSMTESEIVRLPSVSAIAPPR
jgi:hypothetical protein